MQKGDVFLADLDPTSGSVQRGQRPVIILQNDALCKVGNTVIVIPLTTNLRRANLPTAVLIRQGEGGLDKDSVALVHQIRVIDKKMLVNKLGTLDSFTVSEIDNITRYTLDI